MEPAALDELLPDWRKTPPAICVLPAEDEFVLLTKSRRFKLPTPPQMRNHGNFIISLGSLCAWLGNQAEALGVDVFPGFTAAAPLIEEGRVMGVRCGDMGLEKDGNPGPNFAAGVDIHAGTTVLAEGCRGSVSKRYKGVQAGCGFLAPDLWSGLQGTLAPASRPRTPGPHPAHHRLAPGFQVLTAAASSITWTRTGCTWASW